jgi:two-component system, chemotaxis family, chemotaxis protein CheY
MFDPKTKVLVVDDMLTMRKIVSKIVKEIGFTDVVEAADGNDAWTKVQAGGIGLIISDWNMPNCTGLEFLKRIRTDAKFKGLPFILVTAEAEKAQVAEAVQAGVDQYVVKPFTKDALVAKLEMVHKKFLAKKAA